MPGVLILDELQSATEGGGIKLAAPLQTQDGADLLSPTGQVSVNFDNVANNQISGDKIHGGIISGFASEGITDNASNTVVTINVNGNVGVNETNPGAALEVNLNGAPFIGIFGAPQGSGKTVVFKDNDANPTKYNYLIGSQYNVNNGFEITPSANPGELTFTLPAIRILETGQFYVENEATIGGRATHYNISSGNVGKGRKIESHIWHNWGSTGNYTARLYTPIVHNEGNMFTIEIDVYGYGTGGVNQRYVGSGYAYGAGTLISYGTSAILGTLNHRLTTATHPDLGSTVVCFDLGYSSNNGTSYFNHMRWRYQGWDVHKEGDFIWSPVTT